MANPEHVAIAEKGTDAIFKWTLENPGEALDFSGANLESAELSGISISGASFVRADLSNAKLRGAVLTECDMSGANLANCDLFRSAFVSTDFIDTDLKRANMFAVHAFMCDFSGADLSSAELASTHLSGLTLGGTILSEASFGDTAILGCDMSKCVGLSDVDHQYPSGICLDTLIETFRSAGNRLTPELSTFFAGAGVPRELLIGLPSLIREVKYCSCFIAYGEPDRDFADRLHSDLGANGISSWMYALDSTPGQPTWPEIMKNRKEAEKFIVLCSASGLLRDGVRKEIEEQLDEERDKIIPISLDDTWKESAFPVKRGSQDLKPFLMERNYADFGEGKDYEQQLQRLLRGLERRDV